MTIGLGNGPWGWKYAAVIVTVVRRSESLWLSVQRLRDAIIYHSVVGWDLSGGMTMIILYRMALIA